VKAEEPVKVKLKVAEELEVILEESVPASPRRSI
jgi:hypothetical protein